MSVWFFSSRPTVACVSAESVVAAVVEAVGVPVNVLALPGGPALDTLAEVGVRRVSTGSLLASVAYGAMVSRARELRAGSSDYGREGLPREVAANAFG